MAVPRTPSPNERPQSGLSFIWKLVISLLVSLHVIAVFVGPWAMPPYGSELARTIAGGMGPYLQAAFLDNGYRFLRTRASVRGILVRYEIVTRDGQQIEGSFPDRQVQWPRLLYHRYFMLSEFLNSLSAPARARICQPHPEESWAVATAKQPGGAPQSLTRGRSRCRKRPMGDPAASRARRARPSWLARMKKRMPVTWPKKIFDATLP